MTQGKLDSFHLCYAWQGRDGYFGSTRDFCCFHPYLENYEIGVLGNWGLA